jgi:hypothetical protein
MSLQHLLQQMEDPAFDEETYDIGYAERLSPDDRAVFIDRLIANAMNRDVVAILTLGKLDVKEALPMLLSLGRSQGLGTATARRALVMMGRGADVVAEIAHDAVTGPQSTLRLIALQDLAKIGGPIAIDALEQALADPHDHFRMVAWEGLVQLLGLLPHIRNAEGVRQMTTNVELCHAFLCADGPAWIKMGVEEMRAITKRLRAGETPESLGIKWIPQPDVFEDMRGVLYDPLQPFPLDEIAKLSGVMRRMAEMMIAFRLEEHDPRVPESLRRLGAIWTIPILEEALASEETPDDLREPLEECVRELRDTPSQLPQG